jgi:hypothetical protein
MPRNAVAACQQTARGDWGIGECWWELGSCVPARWRDGSLRCRLLWRCSPQRWGSRRSRRLRGWREPPSGHRDFVRARRLDRRPGRDDGAWLAGHGGLDAEILDQQTAIECGRLNFGALLTGPA